MKLFSSPSIHDPMAKPDVLRLKNGMVIQKKDVLAVAGVTVTMLIVGVWLFSSDIGTVQATEQQPETAQVLQAETLEYIDEPVVVETDETLALAMGIDAVISSVPGGELANDLTMVMVGNTIMNRVECSRYPETVTEVLCQPQQFSCFADTGVKWVGKAASDEAFKQRCVDAAERVMNGERYLSAGVIYVSSTKQGTVEAQLDGLYFCR